MHQWIGVNFMTNKSKNRIGKGVTFRAAVQSIPALRFCQGLQALQAGDRKQIIVEKPRCIVGSVNIDNCLKSQYPGHSRWDYAVGYKLVNKKQEIIFWIEIHPAHDKAIDEVIKKREWLSKWLMGEGKALRGLEARYLWISSGDTQFTPRPLQSKKLADSKILYVGSRGYLHRYVEK